MTGIVSPHPESFPPNGELFPSYALRSGENAVRITTRTTMVATETHSSSTNDLTLSSLSSFTPTSSSAQDKHECTFRPCSSLSYCTPPDKSFHTPELISSESPTCVSNEGEEPISWGDELWINKNWDFGTPFEEGSLGDSSLKSRVGVGNSTLALSKQMVKSTTPLKFQQQVRRQLRRIRYRERRAQHLESQKACLLPPTSKKPHVHFKNAESSASSTLVASPRLTSVTAAPVLCLGLPLAEDSIPASWEELQCEEVEESFPCWECQAHTSTKEVGGQLKYEECEIFQEVENALKNGGSVKLAAEGVGGTYIIRDVDRKPIAVFKPADEEAGVPQNPHGHTGNSNPNPNSTKSIPIPIRNPTPPSAQGFSHDWAMSRTPTKGMTYPISSLPGFPPLSVVGGISPGTCWIREIAAYLLDHSHFSGVPETTYAMIPASWGVFSSDKFGSLQRYVTQPAHTSASASNSACDNYTIVASSDVTPKGFSKDDVHRIGILDIRLCNCDRHGGNILALRQTSNEDLDSVSGTTHQNGAQETRLVPIDHGYVLPVTLEDLDFEWLWWPQSSEPFSSDIVEQVRAINPDQDALILRSLGIEEKAIQLMKASTVILQLGVRYGYTLRQIACLLRRPTLSDASAAEKLLDQTTSGDTVEEVDWHAFEAFVMTQMLTVKEKKELVESAQSD